MSGAANALSVALQVCKDFGKIAACCTVYRNLPTGNRAEKKVSDFALGKVVAGKSPSSQSGAGLPCENGKWTVGFPGVALRLALPARVYGTRPAATPRDPEQDPEQDSVAV